MNYRDGNDLEASLRRLHVSENKKKFASELIGYKNVSDDREL